MKNSFLCLLIFFLPVTACQKLSPVITEPGISRELASLRKQTIDSLEYQVFFSIPESIDDSIPGRVTLRFLLSNRSLPLVIDFRQPAGSVHEITANKKTCPVRSEKGHLLIENRYLKRGRNEISVSFLAGESSLNRNREFLYTLFVPDRASTCFPCMDQPDLKATFSCSLEIPAHWEAVANAPEDRIMTQGNRKRIDFRPTPPLPTYLFAFAAGVFEVEKQETSWGTMRFFHRETNQKKVLRNRDEVFRLHENALAWMEEYTGIPYPFDKFDFVLIPSFQYGGMEHPGSIFYSDTRILLNEAPDLQEQLGRANLIAHETSHIWFGDLVTMEWFNDVWLKEVFAGFMADKIVNPSFPEIDHDLLFLLNHYPPSYETDRTAGTHPVAQPLDNLCNAGTLYGNIIYHKAPIAMRMLEQIMGEQALRAGLQQYLNAFAFGNAPWKDLIGILDKLTAEDLQTWEKIWIEEAGMPHYHASLVGNNRSILLSAKDPAGRNRNWPQTLHLLAAWEDRDTCLPVKTAGDEIILELPPGSHPLRYILPNSHGMGYGYFRIDSLSRQAFLEGLQNLTPLQRGVCWINLWENLMHGRVEPGELLDLMLHELQTESNRQVIRRILSYAHALFRQFLDPADREKWAPPLESLLREKTLAASTPDMARTWFMALSDMTVSEETTRWLARIWEGKEQAGHLLLSETDRTELAYELMLRLPEKYEEIRMRQRASITHPDRLEQFDFVVQALSPDPAVRDSCFASFARAVNREHEPWVLQSLSWLHHPFHHPRSEQYILPALEQLEDIQVTGDIFFPGRWLDATLGTYNSQTAAETVTRFLESRPDYPENLRMKILQSSDKLFRASAR
ncbi:MAG: M1 family aminopeptidase [Bacteroidales bacterium]